jgi:hypothetical protein
MSKIKRTTIDDTDLPAAESAVEKMIRQVYEKIGPAPGADDFVCEKRVRRTLH